MTVNVTWFCTQEARLLEEERVLVQQLREQLGTATCRAEEAEQQARLYTELSEETQSLRAEVTTLLTAKKDSDQQCKALQEQLAR